MAYLYIMNMVPERRNSVLPAVVRVTVRVRATRSAHSALRLRAAPADEPLPSCAQMLLVSAVAVLVAAALSSLVPGGAAVRTSLAEMQSNLPADLAARLLQVGSHAPRLPCPPGSSVTCERPRTRANRRWSTCRWR